jgi:beta-glucanase (GH16 family)
MLCGFLGGGARVALGQTLSLVWSDEFNSASIDLTKWAFQTGNGAIVGNPGWGNNELEYYTSRTNNAYVTNGMLHIRAQIEPTNSSEGTFRYTSAKLLTQGLFNKQYGRIEWRAKLPAGTGMWPALWALGSNIVSVPWPGCGEIDVVENNGANTGFVQGSLHSSAGDPTAVYNFTGGDSVTNFHVYDLDWTNSTIVWSVDGVAYETQPTTSAFNLPFFFLMNLAVGGNYVGNPSTGSIDPNMPGEMVIDYMRVYDYVTPTNPPATPTGLTATPGGSQIGLNWNVASNASTYNVKRAAVSGGPYTTIASPSGTSYGDTGVVSCSTYYYVVSGTNAFGESTNSTEAAATLGPYYFAVGSGNTSPAGTFVADTDFVGGTMASPSSATIITTGLTNPAPQAVYQHERYGNSTYTFSGLTTSISYTVRLHLAEIYWNGSNQRKFNVFINGTEVLTNLDIYLTTGGQNIAMIREYAMSPKPSGQISITFSNGSIDQAKSDGIEILLPAATAPTGLAPTPGNAQVGLNWNPVSGATSYNVKRSTTNGGSYSTVTNVTGTSYTDTGLVNWTTYYYVVSTVKVGCESANSTQIATVPFETFAQWQTRYFTSTSNPSADPAFDADGTGQNNQFKYVAGLDPTNPASVFTLTATVTNPPTCYLLLVPMAPGRMYTPQFRTDLVSSVWAPLTGYAGPTTNGNQVTFTDLNATQKNKFYRIDIFLP